MEFLGSIYADDKLPRAVKDQVPAIVRYPTSDIARCYRVVALTMLGQKSVSADLEKLWTRLVAMIMKAGRPKAMRAVSFNGEVSARSMEKTLQDILEEQRKTRILLERLLKTLETGGLASRVHKGYTA